MKVKRYVVDSMPDALQKIRLELGKDAIILNTKEIRSGGFLGLFYKKKIEVIAAMDESGATSRQPPASSVSSAPTAAELQAAWTPPTASSTAELQYAARQLDSSAARSFADSMREAIAIAESGASSRSGEGSDNLRTDAPAISEAVRPHRSQQSKDELLFAEIKQMKDMMARLSAGGVQGSVYPEAIRGFEMLLLEQEVAPHVVEQVLTAASERFTGADGDGSEQAAYRAVSGQLLELIGPAQTEGLHPETRIAHFVGPTGVGKTTTIAKLAAEQALKQNRKVGFITSDTYRIAAVEQLRTYATILNVPLEVVFSPQELTRAFRQLEQCDLIFMDTAGRNYRNPMYVSELYALLSSQGKSETYLVLSLTSKYKDMKAIAENFAKFGLDKVLFTKLDETESYGPILNLLHDFRFRLSYVTDGQNVPDDIALLHGSRLVELLLEEQKR